MVGWGHYIDSGNYTNITSYFMDEKINLYTTRHPKSYKLYWLNECEEVKVNRQVRVAFSIGMYKDDVLCDVLSMYDGHNLLGRP